MTDLNPADRLDSWKEIASFLRRDVRTVQRWEKKEALPVHRHQHEKLGSAQQLEPDHAMLHYILGRCFMRQAKHDEAIAELKAASGAPGDFPLADAALGLAYAVAGKIDEAQKIGARFRDVMAQRYIPPTYFGMLYAGMGDRNRAMIWLNKACAERADGLTWLAVEPMMDDIRSDEGFQELLEKIGLSKITKLPVEP